MEQDLEHYRTEARLALGSQHGGFIRWHDPEVGETVASVLAAETGDPAGESNLAVALERLAEHAEAGTVWEGSVGRSGRSWLRTLTVRVLDEYGEPTAAWIDTVDLVLDPLKDYPLLDEDDYSERHWAVIEEEYCDRYGDAAAGLVLRALSEHAPYPPEEYYGDHDTVLEAVEAELASGHELTDDEVEGLGHYIEQRAAELEIPQLVQAWAARQEVVL